MKKVIITIIILLALMISAGVGFIVIARNEVQELKNAELEAELMYYENIDNELKNDVDQLVLQLDQILADEILSNEEAEEACKDIIRNAVNTSGGHFWADDNEGTCVAIFKADLEGVNRIDLQDVQGTYLIKDFINVAEAGGGYVDYYFPKIGDEESSRKRAYVTLFEPYGWVIGTANYVVEWEQE